MMLIDCLVVAATPATDRKKECLAKISAPVASHIDLIVYKSNLSMLIPSTLMNVNSISAETSQVRKPRNYLWLFRNYSPPTLLSRVSMYPHGMFSIFILLLLFNSYASVDDWVNHSNKVKVWLLSLLTTRTSVHILYWDRWGPGGDTGNFHRGQHWEVCRRMKPELYRSHTVTALSLLFSIRPG